MVAMFDNGAVAIPNESQKTSQWGKFWHSLGVIVDKIGWIAFLLVMAFLPITSFPYFPPAIGGGALVRPLSLYPLFLVILLVIVPRIFKQRLPTQLLALLAFVLIVILSGLFSLFREIYPAYDVSSMERVLRALITLGLGCAFYLAVVLAPRTLTELKTALGAMYTGFAVALAWSSFQLVYVVHFNRPFFRIINHIQSFISTRRLFDNRISGMTYEPNWFAEQMVILLFPWLLASVLTGTSVFRIRWRWLTIEVVMLVWSSIIILLTYSRAGLMTFTILALVVVVIANFKYFARKKQTSKDLRLRIKNTFLSWGFLTQLVVIVIVFGLAYFAIGTRNIFFTRIWGYWSDRSNFSIEGYLNYLGFEARIIYGTTAYNMYKSNPVFGIGPGNYALYFSDMLPYQPLAKTPEVVRLVTPEEGRDRLVTAKNFPLRLMAETGIIGTAAFIAFFITILGSAVSLILSQRSNVRFWGVGGMLALIAFVFSTLSFDSFALPNMWVAFGLITSAAFLANKQVITQA